MYNIMTTSRKMNVLKVFSRYLSKVINGIREVLKVSALHQLGHLATFAQYRLGVLTILER
jgi:hypothetical protein